MHLAFYETIAGVIPVLFLALILEERMAPPNEGFLDHFLPVVTAGFLFIGEVIALGVIYRGSGSGGTALSLSVFSGLAAFLLLGDASAARIHRLDDERLKRQLAYATTPVLLVVLVVIVGTAVSLK